MNLNLVKNKRNIFLIILIIIGIIAILVSIYILNLKPYVAELEKRDRDPARIENLSLIDSALTKLRDTNQNIFWGDQNRVYVSLPSYSANCSGLDLPSLPDDWEYRCKTEADYQNINGTGWLPVNFTKLPKDFKFEKSLPIDPVNTADSGYYYAYVVGEKNDFVITSLLESDEHLKKTALKDGGSDPLKLEIGSNIKLWAKASGLVGYWSFDEVNDNIVKDLSGNNNNGIVVNKPKLIDGKIGKALLFDGTNFVEIKNIQNLSNSKLTIESWIKLEDYDDKTSPRWISKSNSHGSNSGFMAGYWAENYHFVTGDGDSYEDLYSVETKRNIFYHFVGIFDGASKEIKIYLNGNLDIKVKLNTDIIKENNNNILIGSLENEAFWTGTIDEVKIYNRVLSEKEIKFIYNLTK
ncbi:LamG domain-containing protein [Patescibacteria group bacterium]|nr:LamG domain-containing protein [Patescibacteria group bacterium]